MIFFLGFYYLQVRSDELLIPGNGNVKAEKSNLKNQNLESYNMKFKKNKKSSNSFNKNEEMYNFVKKDNPGFLDSHLRAKNRTYYKIFANNRNGPTYKCILVQFCT